MYILIFKTNIDSEESHREIGMLLSTKSSVTGWNIDQEDIDKVLRIESKVNDTNDIINTISRAGFFCEELPD